MDIRESQVLEIYIDKAIETNNMNERAQINHEMTDLIVENDLLTESGDFDIFDHNYTRDVTEDATQKKSQPIPIKNSSTPKPHKPRNVATQRLDKAVEQNSKTIELLQEKNRMKQEYYNKKLELITRDVIAKEKIASELEEIKKICWEAHKYIFFSKKCFSYKSQFLFIFSHKKYFISKLL